MPIIAGEYKDPQWHNGGPPSLDENEFNVYGSDDNKQYARFLIGTSTNGWTAEDCDYLCDGTADDVEIQAAINALPATGGEIVILDGTYNINNDIDFSEKGDSFAVSLQGNGASSKSNFSTHRIYLSSYQSISITGFYICLE